MAKLQKKSRANYRQTSIYFYQKCSKVDVLGQVRRCLNSNKVIFHHNFLLMYSLDLYVWSKSDIAKLRVHRCYKVKSMNYPKKSMHYDWSDVLCHAHALNSSIKCLKKNCAPKLVRFSMSRTSCVVLSLSNLKDSLELALPKLNCAVSFRRNTISYPSSKETFVKQSDIIGRLFKRRLDNVYESHRVTYV